MGERRKEGRGSGGRRKKGEEGGEGGRPRGTQVQGTKKRKLKSNKQFYLRGGGV